MRKGDIILVPFYFTDFKDYKLRPSLIVSTNQSQKEDHIIAFVSTIISAGAILMTINTSIIVGSLGKLPSQVLEVIDNKLKIALSLQ